MNMHHAIAYSSGNKARTYSPRGGFIVVQERQFGLPPGVTWLHVWQIKPLGNIDEVEVSEADIPAPYSARLRAIYSVDPDSLDWSSI